MLLSTLQGPECHPMGQPGPVSTAPRGVLPGCCGSPRQYPAVSVPRAGEEALEEPPHAAPRALLPTWQSCSKGQSEARGVTAGSSGGYAHPQPGDSRAVCLWLRLGECSPVGCFMWVASPGASQRPTRCRLLSGDWERRGCPVAGQERQGLFPRAG